VPRRDRLRIADGEGDKLVVVPRAPDEARTGRFAERDPEAQLG
jgi:hypothetical protein